MAVPRIKSAVFIKSSQRVESCPRPDLPEYAFIGRSNVGKSSLLNMLTGMKRLAKTSATPGKTRLINHFLINNAWYLVDLPGFGYTHISKSASSGWEKMSQKYILKRENLLNLFFLIDSRLNPQKIDLSFFDFLGKSKIPFTMVFTKKDKIRKSDLNRQIDKYQKKLSETWEILPQLILTSAKTGEGKDEILKLIGETNKLWIK